ncbi:hypothetical protein Bca4012_058185 [Brassica carinata]|uniref:Cyclase family protein n=1 Tax=Brassica carinata TaxID=52824 RepID=A0A8X7W472_BRACI|nr:hypothetical protein Bca52824_015934 [Brassica carinata]
MAPLLLFLILHKINRCNVYGNGWIVDITHRITPEMISWGTGGVGLGQFLWLKKSIKKGDNINSSFMNLSVYTGTHVDAPGHFIGSDFDAGFHVDNLDLDVFNGPGLLVDVPRDKNKITAEVMESLNIPKGIKRVLFRTSNTDRGLMYKREEDLSFVEFSADGAKWLVENTDIKLEGVDYLSVAAYDDLDSAHIELLMSKEIIPVEGLKLDEVDSGLYYVNCLPMRLIGAEGSPVRCVLLS